MLSPETLGLIGAVTGIVGATTGSVGCMVGWINYRRSQQAKALDLRLELRKRVSDVRLEVEALPGLLERSRASRAAVLAARGILQSGASGIFKDGVEQDIETVRVLRRELPDTDETFLPSKHHELETKLVEVHALATKAARLRDKYLKELASDDKEREEMRADIRTRAGASSFR